MQLVTGLEARDRRALARAISLVENGAPEREELMKYAYRQAGRARTVGITGAPGVGKSTLVDGLAACYRRQGLTVGIAAVDPTSPFTGGALLGDRVRMQRHGEDAGVFIRSLATRGQLGGLSRATGEVVRLLDAFGFDVVVVETVGAGQSEVDIMRFVSSVVVVVVPGLGDDVQVSKAGIMEIGDVFCINKADHPGADRTAFEITQMLDLKPPDGWRPPLVRTVAHADQGLPELVARLDEHYQYLQHSGTLHQRRARTFYAEVEEVLRERYVTGILSRADAQGRLDALMAQADPFAAAAVLIREYGPEGSREGVEP